MLTKRINLSLDADRGRVVNFFSRTEAGDDCYVLV
jgi:hypothetical protein